MPSTTRLTASPTHRASPPDPPLTGGLPLGSAWPPATWVPAPLSSPPDPLLTGGLPLGPAWPPATGAPASLLSPPDPRVVDGRATSRRAPASGANTVTVSSTGRAPRWRGRRGR